jgi:NAD(P)-dependent dehydrogenase (short-subunit alcohol dehydrogenase family)
MKIIVVGATGTIGSAVVNALQSKHEVIRAARKASTHVDITDTASIRTMFSAQRGIDAVICCVGEARFGALDALTDADFEVSIRHKLMGQVNVVRVGLPSLSERGVFVLTSDMLAKHPMKGSAAISMVNAALEGFTRAAALEAPRGIRVNVVSPPWVRETLVKMGADPTGGMPAADVARAYVAVLEGTMNGATIEPPHQALPSSAHTQAR